MLDSVADLTCVLLIYVDDIIVTDSSSLENQKLIIALFVEFMLEDIGMLKYFLGMELIPIENNGNYVLSQHRYTCDLLHHTNMHNAKSGSIMMASNVKCFF